MSVTSSLVNKNVNLAPYNTLNIDARAEYFAAIRSLEELQSLLRSEQWEETQKFVLGGGSNVLFVGDYSGLVIHMEIAGKKVVKEDENHVWLKIGGGENWHQIVQYCVKKGWGGIENLALIPGTAGAAPIQNIGAYGVELEEVFESLTAVEVESGDKRTFNKEACRFGYRDSIFKQELKGKYVVTDVTLRLSKNPDLNTSYGAIQEKLEEKNINDPSISDICNIVIEIRNSKLPDPTELANAGSFFKNPVINDSRFKELQNMHPDIPGYTVNRGQTKVPAGWLIEETGWKGRELGNTGTYRQQALVIVNHGGTTGTEILELARKIQRSVKEKFDIDLVPEVNIIR